MELVIMTIPIILNPRLSKAVEVICRQALAYGQNHQQIRDSINSLIVLLERETNEPCVETVNLRNLLKRADPDYSSRPSIELDPVLELSQGSKPSLTPEQQSAAYQIKKIWQSFGRYLSVQAKNLESNGSRGRRLDPLDVMSNEVARIWQDVYRPWYATGSKTYIGRTGFNEAEVTLRVVVDCIWPHVLDQRYRLKPGASLIALQHQLDQFQELGQ